MRLYALVVNDDSVVGSIDDGVQLDKNDTNFITRMQVRLAQTLEELDDELVAPRFEYLKGSTSYCASNPSGGTRSAPPQEHGAYQQTFFCRNAWLRLMVSKDPMSSGSADADGEVGLAMPTNRGR